jgi:hypothetical protein
MSFALSGANTLAADDARAVILLGHNFQQASASFVLAGLTPGSTIITGMYRRVPGSCQSTAHLWLCVPN